MSFPLLWCFCNILYFFKWVSVEADKSRFKSDGHSEHLLSAADTETAGAVKLKTP